MKKAIKDLIKAPLTLHVSTSDSVDDWASDG
jgi:hypothetical protein